MPGLGGGYPLPVPTQPVPFPSQAGVKEKVEKKGMHASEKKKLVHVIVA